jgi:hypothetical protein
MNTQSLGMTAITLAIKEHVNTGKPINQQDYDESLSELSYKDALAVQMLFTKRLWKKFGAFSVGKALDENDIQLCKAHAYLESQKQERLSI